MPIGQQDLGGARYTIQADTAQFERGLKEAETYARDFGHKVEQSGRMGAMGLLQLSYAIDDVQYGFSAIVNNIPQIVMGFGGSVGIAGAASVAAVGLNQLLKHFEDLTSKLDLSWHTATVERLNAIRDAADDAAKAFKNMNEGVSGEAEKGAKGFQEGVIKMGGAGVIETAIIEARMKHAGFGAENMPPGGWNARQQEARQRLVEVYRKDAQQLIGAAGTAGPFGDAARARLGGIVQGNEGRFPPGFLGLVGQGGEAGQREHEQFGKQADVRRQVQERIKRDTEEHNRKLEHDAKLEAGMHKEQAKQRKDRLEKQREFLREDIEVLKAQLTPAQRGVAEKRALGVDAAEPAKIMAMPAMINKMMTDVLSKGGNEKMVEKLEAQLKELREINKKIKAFNAYQ